MFRFFIATQFVISVFALILSLAVALIFRAKTKNKAEEQKPSGLWSRAVSISIDLVLIELLVILFAYHGTMRSAGQLSLVIIFSYFFFFWLFFQATPGKIFLRQRIVSQKDELKLWQILVRLVLYPLMGIGWVFILFNKDKKALHDFAAKTKVIYIKKSLEPKDKKQKILSFCLLVIVLIFFISLISHGTGEKITSFKETDNLKFFDVNQDGAFDGILIDTNNDGNFNVVKYDIDNDRIIDFAIYDLDGDGKGEALDINNDGKIDGYDFTGDGKIDVKEFSGLFFVYFWKVWFLILGLAFAAVIILMIILEKNKKINNSRNQNDKNNK